MSSLDISLAFLVVGTVCFIMTAVRQFTILYHSENEDPLLKHKFLLLVFNIFFIVSMLSAFFSMYFNDTSLMISAALFYCACGFISAWTYYSKHK